MRDFSFLKVIPILQLLAASRMRLVLLPRQAQHHYRRGIRGTQVEPSIQDILDEVAPIKEAPYGVEGRFIQM